MTTNGAATKNRSPEHPAIGLEEAITRAREFYEKEHFNYASAASALDHWGYSAKSGSGFRILGALRHFGLLEERGKGDEREVRLSERAKILLLKPLPDAEYHEARREAALAPAIYRKLWDKWGNDGRLPSHETMRWELETRQGFNPNAIDAFISAFKATLAFANLTQDDTLSDEPGDSSGKGKAESGKGKGETPDNGRPMPSTGTTAKRDWDLTIPLVEGGQAVLRVPIPVTPEDFDLLKGVIASNLDAMRKAIVRTPSPPRDGGDDDTG